MILPTRGRFIGKGRLLPRDDVLGIPIECDVTATQDDAGLTFTGEFSGESIGTHELLVNFQPDESGQFDITAGLGGVPYEGKGKLASMPGLVLIWSSDRTCHATFSLFEAPASRGLRALIHDQSGVMGLEIAFEGDVRALGSGNVVSLTSRRR